MITKATESLEGKAICPFCKGQLFTCQLVAGDFISLSHSQNEMIAGDETSDFFCTNKVIIRLDGRPYYWGHYHRRSFLNPVGERWQYYWAIVPPFKIELTNVGVRIAKAVRSGGVDGVWFDTVFESQIATLEEFFRMCKRAKTMAVFS